MLLDEAVRGEQQSDFDKRVFNRPEEEDGGGVAIYDYTVWITV